MLHQKKESCLPAGSGRRDGSRRFHARVSSVTGPGTLAGGYGLLVSGNLRAEGNLDVHGGQVGIIALGRARLRDVAVSEVAKNFAIEARTLHVSNVMSNHNEVGIVTTGRLVADNLTTNDNTRTGMIVYGALRVVGLTATGNGSDVDQGSGSVFYVADHGRPRLVDSSVTGNFFRGTTPVDLLSTTMPRLVRSTCDHSARYENSGAAGSWNVCADD